MSETFDQFRAKPDCIP